MKKSKFFIILGMLCLIVALGLALYNMHIQHNAQQSSEEILKYIDDNGDSDHWKYDGEEYGMVLDIPSIGIRLPIHADYEFSKMETAPCVYSGSIFTDDLVICGHNYITHFKGLKNVSIGADVYLTTDKGIRYSYQVADLEILDPFAYTEMTESDADLTLFTCTWGGQTRLTVRCKRVIN